MHIHVSDIKMLFNILNLSSQNFLKHLGSGAFACQFLKKGSFLLIYSGELTIVGIKQGERREENEDINSFRYFYSVMRKNGGKFYSMNQYHTDLNEGRV